MGKAAKVLQFWRSFLVASVPLAALPLLFVHSEGKVNTCIVVRVPKTMRQDPGGMALPCGVRNPSKHEHHIVCQLGLLG